MILLSWDGTRPDYLDRAKVPALERMRREGAMAERLAPVWPTNTFPNHVSLATGAPVDRHGIVGNVFLDPERGKFDYANDASWLQAEPLWVAAERQGVKAAVYFWVGSETDWNGVGASYRVTPFDSRVPESKKVDQILAWLDLPPAGRPRLVMAWWHGCDHVGHERGPNDPEIARALVGQDRELGRLLAGLDARSAWPHTTLFVVSDHGMAEVSHYVDLDEALDEVGLEARVIGGGGTAHVYVRRVEDRERVRATLDALPEVTAVLREQLDPSLRAAHATRSGDVIATTTPPHTFQRGRAPLLGVFGPPKYGAHGYAADRPDMSATLIALGRGIPRGARLPAASALQIAPTVAHLLGIGPPRQAEAKRIAGIAAAD